MNVILGHQLHKLPKTQTILASSETKNEFGLIISNIISILPHQIFHLIYTHLSLLGESLEVSLHVSALPIIFDERSFEFIEFEHVHILALELG